jgi:hypothetical protein
VVEFQQTVTLREVELQKVVAVGETEVEKVVAAHELCRLYEVEMVAEAVNARTVRESSLETQVATLYKKIKYTRWSIYIWNNWSLSP